MGAALLAATLLLLAKAESGVLRQSLRKDEKLTRPTPAPVSVRVANRAGSVIVPAGWHVFAESDHSTQLVNFSYEQQIADGKGFGVPEGGAIISLTAVESAASSLEAIVARDRELLRRASTIVERDTAIGGIGAHEIEAQVDQWTNRLVYLPLGRSQYGKISIEYVTESGNRGDLEHAFQRVAESWQR